MTNLMEEIEADATRVPEDKLDVIRNKISSLRDLDAKIADAEAYLSSLNRERRDLLFDTLPTMFMQIGLNHVGIAAKGNLPAYKAELVEHFHAVMQSNWPEERREACLKWVRKHKLDDIIKTVLTMEFGLGQSKTLKKVLTALKAIKVVPLKQELIPWSTLTAMVKEHYKAGKPLSDEDLRTLGASVSKIVKITQVREK